MNRSRSKARTLPGRSLLAVLAGLSTAGTLASPASAETRPVTVVELFTRLGLPFAAVLIAATAAFAPASEAQDAMKPQAEDAMKPDAMAPDATAGGAKPAAHPKPKT